MTRSTILSLLAVCACGSPPRGEPPDGSAPEVDASGTPDATIEPRTVTLRTSTAEFIRYRDGAGPWLTPESPAPAQYTLTVRADYQVVIACGDGSSFTAQLFARTSADDAFFYAYCRQGYQPPATTVRVSGTMAQPGSIYLRTVKESETAPWTFEVDIEPGTHDLIAITDEDMVIRRGLDLTAPTELAPIDAEAEGAALVAIPITLDGVGPDEATFSDSFLATAYGFATVLTAGTNPRVAPPSLLQPGDYQDVYLAAYGEAALRTIIAPVPAPGTTFVLPPVLSTVTFGERDGRVVASWTALPDHDAVDFEIATRPGGSVLRVQATRSWLELNGAGELAFDALPPDYDPAWTIDLDEPQVRSFGVTRADGDVQYYTQTSELAGSAAAGVDRGPRTMTRRAPSRDRW